MVSIKHGGVAALLALLASVLLSACGGSSSTTQIPANATIFFAHTALFNNNTSVTTTLYTVGYNGFGQLGNDDSKLQTTTTAAPVPNLGPVNLFAVGGDHTLAAFRNNTFRNNTTVYSFGSNNHGQLGVGDLKPTTGTNAFSRVPIKVHFTIDANTKSVKDVAAGVFHSLAVVGSDATSNTGTVYSWGYNGFGQLGNIKDLTTTTFSDANAPVQVVDVSGAPLQGITHVAAGANHSLALTANGTVYAWGNNNYGQLGVEPAANHTGLRAAADLVQLNSASLDNVIQIAAGGGSTSYALRADGSVVGWGYDGMGQLGPHVAAGLSSFSATPVVIIASGVVQISAGQNHLLARMSDGTVQAVGFNQNAQLGDNTTVSSSTPVTVLASAEPTKVSLTGVTNILAIGNHSLAFAKKPGDTAPHWYGWGDNGFGELGNDISTTSIGYLFLPTLVRGL